MYIIYHYCLLQVVAIIIGLLVVGIFVIGRYMNVAVLTCGYTYLH